MTWSGFSETGQGEVPRFFEQRNKPLVSTEGGEFLTSSSTVPPLWFIRQSSWLQIQKSRVRFQALPDFMTSSGSGTVFTQPREDN
jgi:hypothetical protein